MTVGMAANFLSRLNLTRTYDTVVAGGQAGTAAVGNETTRILSDGTTPNVTEGDFVQQLMTAGAATIDLAALASTQSRAFSLSGLKVRMFKVTALAGNLNPVTLSKGATNGYTGFGSAFSVTLQPGQSWTFEDAGNGVAVSGTVKTLDLAGTGTQGVTFSIAGGA